MKSPKLTILLLLLLFWSISSLLQTGLVNVNQQLNIETINQNSNTLCYTQIFARPFQNKPQVSTALTLFDIDNCQDYQLAIKTRKSQLSLTEVKFLVVGRKSLGLWKRVSFTYFAADLSDIVTAVYYAGIIQTNIDTVDLSGCGKILRQQFIVPVVEKWANPQIAIFLTAFDLTTTTYNSQASLFQVSIQKLHYKNQTLTVSVSRKSPVQIYSVSFSYVIINTQQQTTFKFQSFYNTEIANFKTGTSQGSRWREVKQKLEFWKGGQFYGFNQFSFGNSGNDRRRELAITLTDTHVLFGSKIATELEQVTINYLLIRQRSPCTQNQITLYDPISNTQKCEQCPQSKRQTSNPQKNACICLPNHFTYQDRCMPIPQNSQFSHQKNGYICESGYEWIYHKKQDKFYCKVPPMFTTWNAEAQKFVCVAGYYFVDGKCQIPKENQIYDVAIKGFRCSEGSTKVDGRCVKAHQNQVWSESLKQFVCVENTYRIESLCLSTPKNMQYSHSVHKFVCLKSFYPVNENICEPLPQNRVWDSSEKRLKCIEGLYEVQQGCKQLPKNCDYSASDKVFNCIKGYYRLVGGLCQKPGQNQQYELSTQQFVCASGSYKIGGKCKYPIKDSYYCSIANTFLCKQGYFRIGEECLSPGKNQVYNQLTKSFKCSDGFYSANNQQCSKVPQNKVYSIQLKKLVCVNGYFEMSDSSCQKPSVNQEYNAKLKIFACRQNYYLIDKFCRLLPQNCIYNSPNSSFTCRAGFYRREYQCLVCQTNCLQCQSNQKCTKCSEGYEAKNGKCEEKCGDGIRIGHECDDGNVNDGDGCSKECIIEQGWSCKGGSKTTPDTCRKLGLTTVKPSETQIVPIIAGTGSTYQNKNVELRMVGLSHLFGKIILNIKTDYIPEKLLQNASQINSMFKVLTNCKIPLKVSTMYIKNSTYTFVILYDFNLEPIPDYLTRVQMNQEIKQKYYADWKVKPLLIRIDPAIMAKQDKNQDNLLV